MNVSLSETLRLSALFVDDDPEIVEQCEELLPAKIDGHEIEWTFVDSFEEAAELLSKSRFDVLVTDVYKGRKLSGKLGVSPADNFAAGLVKASKDAGFSLIVLYSDGPRPEELIQGSSIKFVDKSSPEPAFPGPITEMVGRLLQGRGRILDVIRRIRNDLDRVAGSYIWGFVEEHWELLQKDPEFNASGLERLIRRRAATQINELLQEGGLERRESSDKYDYYILPPLPGPLKLGTILKRKEDGAYFLVLTPHCHLVPNGRDGTGKPRDPRADMVLVSACLPAREVVQEIKTSDRNGCLRIPSRVGTPDGRLCFLPGFATLPDLFCDLMRLTSIPFTEIGAAYEQIAVLDSPFAEAVQSSMTRFYANVGHRNLVDSDFSSLFSPAEKKAEAAA